MREPTSERPEPGGEEVLQGTVEVVTFHGEETGYAVLRVSPEEGYDDAGGQGLFRAARLTAVGTIEDPMPGLRVRLFGRWGSHKSHGRQFEFDGYEVLTPADEQGLVRYLASPAFEGIGETLARRIVERLGPQTLERIRAQPEDLAGIAGLRKPVREALIERVRAEFEVHRLHAFLRSVGLGPRQTVAVVRRFGPDSEALLRADPYRLAGAAPGLGFALADRIALKLGLAEDGPERCRAGLLHVLRSAASSGHSLQRESELFEAAGELLGEAAGPVLPPALEELAAAAEVVIEDGEGEREVYLPWLATSEAGLAGNVAHLVSRGEVRALAGEGELETAERASGLTLDPGQREAVLGLLRQPVALLTGGPGVGKTTIVRLVVALAESAGARVALASPTGRAAKRLAEATGRPASTIHRLLGFDPEEGGFRHDARRPLETDLVVIDELSMLDVVLAHHLFKALQPPTRVVLVGDPDQLPSVAPGNVLADLIASESVPLFRLTHIHRQSDESRIVTNAHRILQGFEPELPERGDHSSDFYFFPAETPEQCAERVTEVVTERIPQTFGLSWQDDVQVLAPMYRGPCGVDRLNELLRERVGAQREVEVRGRTWREGDRVIHTRNDYEKEVFNGDMGRIVLIGAEGLRVAFPEQEVYYDFDELSDLQPAFAVTVHRSQGSEYEAVVIPLVTQHYMMLQRNLLYTAVTRARRLLVLVGSRRALRMALDNAEPSLRRSALERRVRARVEAREAGPG